MRKWSSKTKNSSMQNNEDSLYNKHVCIISVLINCLVKEMDLNEKKNDLIEEWCIAVDCLFNWLLLYVCRRVCKRSKRRLNTVYNSNINE